MASPLVGWLAGRTADELAGVLARRPDVLGPPTPADLADLATRLQSRGSVATALAGLPRPAIQVIEAVQALGGPTTPVERLAGLLGRPVDDPELGATLAVLAGRALVWPDGTELRMAGPLWSAFPHPLGLGDRAEQLLAGVPGSALRAVARTLALPPARGQRELLTGICAALANGELVRDLVAAAPPAARELLTELAHDGPLVAVAAGGGGPTAGGGAGWAMRHGLLVWDGWRHAHLPAEVGVALRGPAWRASFEPAPPRLTLVDIAAGDVAREAAAAATAAVEEAGALLELVDSAPATMLKTGGVGSRELRRLARSTGCDEHRVRLWLELAYAAGLVGVADGQLRPTDGYDEWRAVEPAGRLPVLLRAWPRLPATPLARARADGTPPAAALLRDGAALAVGDLRTALLRTIGELPDGRGVPDEAELTAALSWQLPLLAGPDPATRLGVLTSLCQEARVLGAVAHGALSGLGRSLLDDPGALPAAAEALLPGPLAEAVFQNDLTAVVPGAPRAALADLLDAAAVRESRGGGSTWRFTAASVRAALDAGRGPAELLDDLRAVATGGALPQGLEYLIADVGRQHGRVRVRSVGCVLRADDPALVAELVRARALRPLKLSALAPTVLASSRPAEETLRTLRAAGYPPLGEDAEGQPRIERPRRRRAPRPRRPGRAARPGAGPAELADPAELAARLSAAGVPGPLATVIRLPMAGPAGPLSTIRRHAGQLGPDEQRRLAAAVDRGGPVKIGYRNAAGEFTVRIVEPVDLDQNRLVAWCHLRTEERTFAVDRIESVTPA